MLSRRALIGKMAAGTAGAAVTWAATIELAKVAFARGDASTRLDFIHDHDGPQSAPQAAAPQVTAPQAAPPLEATTDAPASEPAPWELLRPLALGSVVAHGWRIAELSAVEAGSCVLTLKNGRGRMHRVHLCGNDGRPQGIVYTRQSDLLVMNGGRGDLPTEEGLAQAVAEVAHVVAANEGSRQQQQLAAALMPHAERVRAFATSADARLR